MKFSKQELKLIVKNNYADMTIEDEIAFNIMNFINCVKLNKQNFYEAYFDSQYYGDLGMTFKKNSDCLIGHCRVIVKKENKVYDYLFTENGFEKINDLIFD